MDDAGARLVIPVVDELHGRCCARAGLAGVRRGEGVVSVCVFFLKKGFGYWPSPLPPRPVYVPRPPSYFESVAIPSQLVFFFGVWLVKLFPAASALLKTGEVTVGSSWLSLAASVLLLKNHRSARILLAPPVLTATIFLSQPHVPPPPLALLMPAPLRPASAIFSF
jgi:hypothetical protein